MPPAERLAGLGDEVLDAVLAGRVAGHRLAADLGGDGPGGVGVQVVDHDPGALGGEGAGQCGPDAATRPADEDPCSLVRAHWHPFVPSDHPVRLAY